MKLAKVVEMKIAIAERVASSKREACKAKVRASEMEQEF